jgi:enamine deaminase RidA (YjgF/YER057c/UK114 family)
VLDQIQQQLESAGSSMEKVKCNVYLKDINDWAAMSEVFHGRFGEEPPVRTTIAAGGIPGIRYSRSTSSPICGHARGL